jgi:hypothetical protein
MTVHLYTVTMPKKQMAQAVQKFCSACMSRQLKRDCPSKDCDLYPIRILRTVMPDQAHLFRSADFPAFVRDVVQAAQMLSEREPVFGFDQLRGECHIQPLHQNWFGSVTRTRAWRTEFEPTGEHQISNTKSRAGGMQLLWRRRVKQEDARKLLCNPSEAALTYAWERERMETALTDALLTGGKP